MSKETEAEIMAIFATLGDELAKDIISHRRGLKCPLTARGAKGLMREYLMAGDPVAAAEYHLNQGWRGFDHTWMKKPRNQGNGRRTIADVAAEIDARFADFNAPVGLPNFTRN